MRDEFVTAAGILWRSIEGAYPQLRNGVVLIALLILTLGQILIVGQLAAHEFGGFGPESLDGFEPVYNFVGHSIIAVILLGSTIYTIQVIADWTGRSYDDH